MRLASSGQTPSVPAEHLGMHTARPGTPPQPRISQFQMPVVPRLRNNHSKQSFVHCSPSELLWRVQKACAQATWVWSSLPGSDWDFPPRAPGTGSSAAHPSCPGTFSPDLPKARALTILPAYAPPPLAALSPWHSTGHWPRSPGNIPDLCFGFLQLLAAACWPSEPEPPARLAEPPIVLTETSLHPHLLGPA